MVSAVSKSSIWLCIAGFTVGRRHQPLLLGGFRSRYEEERDGAELYDMMNYVQSVFITIYSALTKTCGIHGVVYMCGSEKGRSR